jgi:hypothetical protein
MKPKLIIKTGKTRLLKIELLNSTKHLVVDLELLPVVARLRLGRERGSAAAAL